MHTAFRPLLCVWYICGVYVWYVSIKTWMSLVWYLTHIKVLLNMLTSPMHRHQCICINTSWLQPPLQKIFYLFNFQMLHTLPSVPSSNYLPYSTFSLLLRRESPTFPATTTSPQSHFPSLGMKFQHNREHSLPLRPDKAVFSNTYSEGLRSTRVNFFFLVA